MHQKTWKSRNGEEFDLQYKEPKQMFVKWWNRMANEQAEIDKKTVKTYYANPNGDYVEY